MTFKCTPSQVDCLRRIAALFYRLRAKLRRPPTTQQLAKKSGEQPVKCRKMIAILSRGSKRLKNDLLTGKVSLLWAYDNLPPADEPPQVKPEQREVVSLFERGVKVHFKGDMTDHFTSCLPYEDNGVLMVDVCGFGPQKLSDLGTFSGPLHADHDEDD